MKTKVLLFFLPCLFFLFTAQISYTQPVTSRNALETYLNNGDNSLKWNVVDEIKDKGITAYRIVFTSQQWHGIFWTHELVVVIPKKLKYNDALLFITGGSNKDGQPKTHKWDEGLSRAIGKIAITNKSVAALLWQVPNQPLFDNLKEDALISYTLHNFRDDGDYSWPLLFPMTKSAVRAMDVVQMLTKQKDGKPVDQFVIAGASKRGWTTWLSGAADKRVKAIAPMVIDMLNMPVSMDYQKEAWGDYSEQIKDYVNLGIVQKLDDKNGKDIVQMIDPYSYRETLTMPKMIFIAANDEYWPVDAVKNYIDSIPGDNRIHYIPNAGHDMGDHHDVFKTLNAFFSISVTDSKYPVCDYSVEETNGKIKLKIQTTPKLLVDVILWTATSEDRDFRNDKWTSGSLGTPSRNGITVETDYPVSGFKAFYVDLKYRAPFGGDYTESTRMFVSDQNHILKK